MGIAIDYLISILIFDGMSKVRKTLLISKENEKVGQKMCLLW